MKNEFKKVSKLVELRGEIWKKSYTLQFLCGTATLSSNNILFFPSRRRIYCFNAQWLRYSIHFSLNVCSLHSRVLCVYFLRKKRAGVEKQKREAVHFNKVGRFLGCSEEMDGIQRILAHHHTWLPRATFIYSVRLPTFNSTHNAMHNDERERVDDISHEEEKCSTILRYTNEMGRGKIRFQLFELSICWEIYCGRFENFSVNSYNSIFDVSRVEIEVVQQCEADPDDISCLDLIVTRFSLRFNLMILMLTYSSALLWSETRPNSVTGAGVDIYFDFFGVRSSSHSLSIPIKPTTRDHFYLPPFRFTLSVIRRQVIQLQLTQWMTE